MTHPTPALSRRALRPLAALLLAGLGAGAHAADDTLLNPVVVTGSRSATESFELPYAIDVVDRQAITAGQLGVNASEALSGVPGIVVQNRQNYAQDLQISVRGFGARAAFGVRGVKLLADGIPASNPDGQGQAATFNLDMAERIEVLRGPFSTVYGNHAGGVIQLFTRDPAARPSLSARVLGGSFGTYKIGLGAEGTRNGVGYLLDVSHFDTDGFRDHSAATRDQAYAKFTAAPDADSQLTLTANGLRQNGTQDPKGVKWATYNTDPKAVEQIALDYNTRKDLEHAQAGATYVRRFGAHRLEVQAYAGQRSVLQYLSIPAGAQGAPTSSGGVVDFDRDFFGVGGRWIHNTEIGDDVLTLTAGLDYDWAEDDRQGYNNFVGSTLGVRGILRRDETDTISSTDPYIQASYDSGPWTLSAGLRHSRVRFEVKDDYLSNGDDSGSQTYSRSTPALGLVYRLSPAVNLYASAGAGFETPTLGEVSYSSGSGTLNLDLKPSRSQQFEVGAKARIGADTRLNAAAFQIHTDDEIVVASSSGGRTTYQNAGSTLRQGVELALDTRLNRQLTAKASFTHMRAVYDEAFMSGSTTVDAGKRLPGIPATTVYGELAWKPLGEGFTAAIEGQYRSRVEVEDTNTDRAAPAYALFNLRLTAEQKHGDWTFGQMLRVDNLFDRQHVGSVVVGDAQQRYYEPGPGTAVYAGLSASYGF